MQRDVTMGVDQARQDELTGRIWDGDPTADITVLQRPDQISVIIKDGRIVDRAAAGGFLQLSEEPSRARMAQ